MAEKGKQGFADMDPEEHRAIAAEGGRSSGKGKAGAAVAGDEAHDSHHDAAFHHSTAAHHHRQAARHRKGGNHDLADRHHHAAHSHSTAAHEHSKQGFAAMDPERVRELGRQGGLASHGGRGNQAAADQGDDDADRRTARGKDPISQKIADESTGARKGNGQAPTPGGQGGSHEQHVEAGRQSHKNTPHKGDAGPADDEDDPDRRTTRGKDPVSQKIEDESTGARKGDGHSPTPGGQGGSHEQHVNAGRQSHKNTTHKGDAAHDDGDDVTATAGTQGGSPEQHAKAGKQSHKNG